MARNGALLKGVVQEKDDVKHLKIAEIQQEMSLVQWSAASLHHLLPLLPEECLFSKRLEENRYSQNQKHTSRVVEG